MTNLAEHKCAGKCPEFNGEQCNHCLITEGEAPVALFVSGLDEVDGDKA